MGTCNQTGTTVTLTVASALKNSPDTECPDNIITALYSELLGTALKRKIRQEKIFSLMERMEQNGIHCVLLKGADVARYYSMPECRISADTDILIREEDEQRAYDFLRKEGLNVEPCAEGENHANCRNAEYGLIELHLRAWPDEVKKYTFKGKGLSMKDHQIEIDGHSVYVLEPTTAAIFLTLHLVKHFVYSGINLRILMDMVLYLKNNKDEIDFDCYTSVIRDLHYTNLLANLFEISVRYFGCDRSIFPSLDADAKDSEIEAIINDTEQGGWMGMNKESERWNVWVYYLREKKLSENSRVSRVLAYIKRMIFRIGEALFPSVERLSKNYPDVKRKKWKYPFYLFHRLIFRVGKRVLTGKLEESTVPEDRLPNKNERKRLDLLRDMNVI